MRRRLTIALLALLAMPVITWAQPHGATHGVAGVSGAGAATYTIPTWMPAGPGGLTPQLSLSYSSLGGQGVAGRGWGLAGVSTSDYLAYALEIVRLPTSIRSFSPSFPNGGLSSGRSVGLSPLGAWQGITSSTAIPLWP